MDWLLGFLTGFLTAMACAQMMVRARNKRRG